MADETGEQLRLPELGAEKPIELKSLFDVEISELVEGQTYSVPEGKDEYWGPIGDDARSSHKRSVPPGASVTLGKVKESADKMIIDLPIRYETPEDFKGQSGWFFRTNPKPFRVYSNKFRRRK